MKTIYETLEMNKIQEQLLHYCASTLGKDKIQSLQMFDDEEELQEALDKVEEAMQFIERLGRLPLGGLTDMTSSLKKANRDGTLTGEELLLIQAHLECVMHVQNYFQNSVVFFEHILA